MLDPTEKDDVRHDNHVYISHNQWMWAIERSVEGTFVEEASDLG